MRLTATHLRYSMVDHSLFMGKGLVFLELCTFITPEDIKHIVQQKGDE